MVKRGELILVNSMRPKEEVIEDVWRHVERLLPRKL
jgi:hypothetical protein